MRPIRLAMKSFTAFREEQVLDLEGLDLFAISGPTGSGKSSILDAITYALFGYVERVGKQVAQLISQGQPRMAVTFEFAVDGDRYRVTRSTPAKGGTQVLFERARGDGWVQAGEGADKVGSANELIRRAIGLDYDAFTRTVLLPQGRFAEFLVGDAKERRAILTELLGLELFERLARRAGEAKRDAEAQARARASLLETEYAGVSPEAVTEAASVAEAAAERERALADAEQAVRAVAERWSASARTVEDLRACERDLREAERVARGVAETIAAVRERTTSLRGELQERARALAAAERAAARARAEREKHEERWGRAVDLAALVGRAEALVAARRAVADAEAEHREAAARVPALADERARAEEGLSEAAAQAEVALERLAEAEAAADEARHADLVAAVRAGVRVGDDCPVCGAPVASLPKATKALPLEKAEATLGRARSSAERARTALADAERRLDRASHAVEVAEAEAARCREAVERARANAERVRQEVAPAFGGKVPADPVERLQARRARLEELEEADEVARGRVEEARVALQEVERRRDATAEDLAEARGRLGALAVSGLLDRASGLVEAIPAAPAPLAGTEDHATLLEAAAAAAEALSAAAEALAAAAADRDAQEESVAREAAALLDGLVDLGGGEATVAEVVDLAAAARSEAAREAGRAADRARQAAEKLANAQQVAEQVAGHQARAAVFDALAKELRQDRLIAFLQLEALELLAASASESLATLSSGRYRLEFAVDEFFVVDTWNGEERRSARTLSGGETFLASLALALALSEQVGALSVTEQARLDSLFLDEGFGTLDPDTLDVVVDAIEQLGGDGRMVGVITHVPELASRMPVRIEVEKSPRGSRATRIAS